MSRFTSDSQEGYFSVTTRTCGVDQEPPPNKLTLGSFIVRFPKTVHIKRIRRTLTPQGGYAGNMEREILGVPPRSAKFNVFSQTEGIMIR